MNMPPDPLPGHSEPGNISFQRGNGNRFFRFYLLADSKEEKSRILARFFRLSFSIALLGGITLYATAGYWSEALVQSTAFVREARQIAIAVAANTLTIVPLALLRAESRWKPFLSFNLLKFFALIIVNTLMLVSWSMGIEGITLTLAIVNSLLALLFIPYAIRRTPAERFFRGWKTYILYGAPLLATDFAFWVLNSQGSLFLKAFRSNEEVALFGFALRIASIAQVAVIMPFSIAFAPLLFKADREMEDPRYLYARTMGYIWVLSLFFCLGITIFSPEIAAVLGVDVLYRRAVFLVPWMVFSSAFYGIYFVFSSGPNLKSKTWIFPVALFIAGLLEAGYNLIFIRSYGLLASVHAMLAGYFILAVVTYLFSQKYYPIHFPWKRVFHSALLTFIYLFFWMYILSDHSLLVRGVAFALFPFFLIISGYLDAGEWKVIRSVLRVDKK